MDAGAVFVARSIEHHLRVRPEHVTKLPSGKDWDIFEAALRERSVLFKADRRIGQGRVVLEAWACQRARELGAPAPRVLATDLGREIYPRNFIIVEKVLGVPLPDVDVDLGERRRLVREAGWAIRAVHEIGVPGFGLLHEATYLRNAQVRGEFDTWEEFINRVLGVTIPVLRSGAGWDDAGGDRIGRLLSDHASYFELGPVGHLLHGTFDPSCVFVHEGKITGLVGFGERSSGDPAWDLGRFLIDNIADTRDLLEGYDPDKEQAVAFEVTIPLFGGLRAISAAGRAHEEGRVADRDSWLALADSSFAALGYPGSRDA